MNCFVYRSEKKQGMFLYLRDKDDFSHVPESLIKILGQTTYSFEFDLSKDRKLLRAESQDVIKALQEKGYFLQMPPAKSEMLGIRVN